MCHITEYQSDGVVHVACSMIHANNMVWKPSTACLAWTLLHKINLEYPNMHPHIMYTNPFLFATKD
jgi:hypothetical protein